MTKHVVFVSFLIVSLISATVLAQEIKPHDIFISLESNYADLTYGESEFIIKNPTDQPFVIDGSTLTFSVNDLKGNKLKGIDVFYFRIERSLPEFQCQCAVSKFYC